MPIQQTTEFVATAADAIPAISRDLAGSDRRYRVFKAVYGGGNKPKNASLLALKTGLSEMAVLQLATPMAHKQYFEQVRDKGRVAFKKYPHINAVKHRILSRAKNPDASRLPNRQAAPLPGRRARAVRRASGDTGRTRPSRRLLNYDVFVSHASEDKDFVRPLVRALKRAGISVWYDNDVIGWGDDLRSAIDNGLANCRFGIVVFSKAFLRRKHWTEHELNGLFARERSGKKVILPIWHKIDQQDLLAYSPAFADRIAKVSKKDSIADIVKSLKLLLRR